MLSAGYVAPSVRSTYSLTSLSSHLQLFSFFRVFFTLVSSFYYSLSSFTHLLLSLFWSFMCPIYSNYFICLKSPFTFCSIIMSLISYHPPLFSPSIFLSPGHQNNCLPLLSLSVPLPLCHLQCLVWASGIRRDRRQSVCQKSHSSNHMTQWDMAHHCCCPQTDSVEWETLKVSRGKGERERESDEV